MLSNILIRELCTGDFDSHFVENFDRKQNVTKVFRGYHGQKKEQTVSYVDDWSKSRRLEILGELKDCMLNTGIVLCAVHHTKIIGFAAINSKKTGPDLEYNQLEQMQIEKKYRNRGIGKLLFTKCIECARERGFNKIYISANSAFQTIKFYQSLGCTDAAWVSPEQIEKEPFDWQMEYTV
jgi:GNAT superfamily N-acetyltransferase